MVAVPYDPDWADLGFIEPEFVEEVVGYYDEELLVNRDDIVAIHQFGSAQPTYVRTYKSPLPDPVAKKEVILRWVTTDADQSTIKKFTQPP